MSLFQLNTLGADELRRAVRPVVPPAAFEHLMQVDAQRFSGNGESEDELRVILDPITSELHVRIPAEPVGGDYALSLDLEEAGAGQLRLGFIIINDLTGPRFNIDRTPDGALTLLGTASRNLDAEQDAMAAGLGPCQVRRGLRMFGQFLPRLEAFARRLGYVAIVLEPLTYHNAVMYERHGFAYITGRKLMTTIDDAFQPDGALHHALDDATPFRRTGGHSQPRARSWAIHDHILEVLRPDLHLDLQMVKVIGQHAGVQTFGPGPDSKA